MLAYVCPKCGGLALSAQPPQPLPPGVCGSCSAPFVARQLHFTPLGNGECMTPRRAPAVVRDKVNKYMDYGLGHEVTSRSEMRAEAKRRGLREKSWSEFRQQYPSNVPQKPGMIVNYPGMKDRRSSSERNIGG